jgi:AbrB family looped-hinge helix DNA binding protein
MRTATAETIAPAKPKPVRITPAGQVSIPKHYRDAMSITTGDYLMPELTPDGLLFRPQVLAPAAATPDELRAFKRGRAEAAAGKTMPYEQYRTDRAQRLDRQRGPKRAKAAR